MKKLSLFVLLLAVGVFFVSCDKNEDNNVEKKSELSFGDNVFDLSWGLIEYYGKLETDDEAYNFDIMLLDSGLVFDETTEELKGKGSGIYFETFSQSSTELSAGTYSLDTTSKVKKPFTFDYGSVAYKIDTSDEGIGDYVDVKSGTFKIEKSGDIYEVTIDCTGENGEKITGYYKGTLKSYDYSKKKSLQVVKKGFKE